MTKKDFIRLAQYLKDTEGRCEPFTKAQVEHLANFCHEMQPKFKRESWVAYIIGEEKQ